MKVFNKILIASSMVVTLGAAISCDNKQNANSGGVPYTYFALRRIHHDEEYTVGFKYKGSSDIKVYWGFDSTTPSKETSHTFECTSYSYIPVVRIEGSVSSIWFTDEAGEPIEKDNDQIDTILFSNTITSIPKMACYSLINLESVFIPNSVKQVGANAFFGPAFSFVICAANGRPSGWDRNWASTPFVTEIVIWGVNYYLIDDNIIYVTYTLNQAKDTYYCGHLFPPNEEIKELEIPRTVSINNVQYDVTGLLSVGAINGTLEKITVHNNVRYIGPEAVAGCSELNTVKFDDNFERLFIDEAAFGYCASLTRIDLPKGLISIPIDLFIDCANLENVTIPNTVKWISDDSFYYCSGNVINLKIDVTSYKDPNEIARCDTSPFDWPSSQLITFIYDSNSVDVSDFVNKSWPNEGRQSYGPQVHWEPAPTNM